MKKLLIIIITKEMKIINHKTSETKATQSWSNEMLWNQLINNFKCNQM